MVWLSIFQQIYQHFVCKIAEMMSSNHLFTHGYIYGDGERSKF